MSVLSINVPADSPWTLPEVSSFLREDARTTRRRVHRGELNPIVLPGSRRYLFDPSQVRNFVSRSCAASDAA
jgi:hypothetical protein